MCFELDSLPPIPEIAGAAVSHEDLVLSSADGTRFAAFAAAPDEPSAVGIVVLPDVRGLYRFYEELALRFAERGSAAIAIDYFGRTARSRQARRRLPLHGARRTDRAGDDPGRCRRGGRVAALARGRLARAHLHGRLLLRRAPFVARCGGRSRARRRGRLLRLPRRAERPARARSSSPRRCRRRSSHYRQATTPTSRAEDNAAFDGALAAAGVEHEVVTYEGAPHSFFDRKQADHQAASDDAWARVVRFIAAHA